MARTLDWKKKTSTSPTHREIPLIKKTYHRKTDGQKERERREGGCKNEDKSLIDVEHVETVNINRIKQ